MAEQLAKAFGAELAASRPICDNGWLPMERQIGSSGQTVAPKLYVALGISGAIQHLVGMKGAKHHRRHQQGRRRADLRGRRLRHPGRHLRDRAGARGRSSRSPRPRLTRRDRPSTTRRPGVAAAPRCQGGAGLRPRRAMEREQLEVDVLIVGGGPAGLSAALRLAQLQKKDGGEPLSIAVLEKAREVGRAPVVGRAARPVVAARSRSPTSKPAAVRLRPRCSRTTSTSSPPAASSGFPITPPPFQNHGNYIISLNQFTKWLGEQVEAEGVDLFTGFPAQLVLFDGNAGDRRAHRRQGRRPPRRAEGRPSSPAPTSWPRSRSSPTVCAATSPRS